MRLVPLPGGIATNLDSAHALQRVLARATPPPLPAGRGVDSCVCPPISTTPPPTMRGSLNAVPICPPDLRTSTKEYAVRRKTIGATIAGARPHATYPSRQLGPLQMTLMGIGVTAGQRPRGIALRSGRSGVRPASPQDREPQTVLQSVIVDLKTVARKPPMYARSAVARCCRLAAQNVAFRRFGGPGASVRASRRRPCRAHPRGLSSRKSEAS